MSLMCIYVYLYDVYGLRKHTESVRHFEQFVSMYVHTIYNIILLQ